MKISYPGIEGSYSSAALKKVYPDAVQHPCHTFQECIDMLEDSKVDKVFIPIENSIGGRVAEVHHILRDLGFFIEQEYFEPICHHLLVIPGTPIENIRRIYSHPQALAQCAKNIHKHKFIAEAYFDTAGAAQYVVRHGDTTAAAIASQQAGELYGLETAAAGFNDDENNVTRFVVIGKSQEMPLETEETVTSIIMKLHHIPAALYKALGVFAEGNINLLKIESYVQLRMDSEAEFYIEVEAHPKSETFRKILEGLKQITHFVKIVGVYKKGSAADVNPQQQMLLSQRTNGSVPEAHGHTRTSTP